ncbi:MAG: GNAT family N-acetyltransferase [Bacteroidota bacterium]
MIIRPYHHDQDQTSVHRIWREVHWIDKDQEPFMDHFLSSCKALVAEIDQAAECLVASTKGDFQYLQQPLPLSAISGVTTSRIARKQGLAGRMTAQMVASDAAEGAAVSALGMFEQGFYNRLGFGTGPYENFLYFDPADLLIDQAFRVPKRLSQDDWEIIHQAMCARQRGHGSVNLHAAMVVRAELGWGGKGFGLGYQDGPDGQLSHFMWIKGDQENGPYEVNMLIYQNAAQLLELLALLKSLGDQIRLVGIFEPPEIQVQDLIRQPFKGRKQSKRSAFEQRHRAEAFWQIRICDLQACIEAVHVPGDSVAFNLELTDPIENFLDEDQAWRGIGGKYHLSLGPESQVATGFSEGLPVLKASVGAFSRLWLGVRPASGLAITDELEGPADLLRALDQLLRLPKAHLGWEF